jgi:predicted RecA/RadA family phage recombinase
MSFKAQFLHGEPVMVDHTPVAAVAAGDVLKVGSSLRIAHSDIAAGALGAVSIGGGVYNLTMATGTNTSAFAAGDTVNYDTTNGWAQSGTNANTIKFGQAVLAAGTAGGQVTALHIPQA